MLGYFKMQGTRMPGIQVEEPEVLAIPESILTLK